MHGYFLGFGLITFFSFFSVAGLLTLAFIIEWKMLDASNSVFLSDEGLVGQIPCKFPEHVADIANQYWNDDYQKDFRKYSIIKSEFS